MNLRYNSTVIYKLLPFIFAVVLGACGGGGGSNATPPQNNNANTAPTSVFAVSLASTNGLQSESFGGQNQVSNASDYVREVQGNSLKAYKYVNFEGNSGTATISGTGQLGGISFGRWETPGATGNVVAGASLATVTNPLLAYVFATPDASNHPSTGTKTLALSTQVAPSSAANLLGSASASALAINFGALTAQQSLRINTMTVTMGSSVYTIAATQEGFSTPWFSPNDGGRINLIDTTINCTGTGCGTNPSAIKIDFSGVLVNATGDTAAGLSYFIVDPTGTHKAITGVLIFKN
jgi:hypothetical protein